MGFFRTEKTPPEEGGQESLKTLDSVDALLRAAEQDERVEQMVKNFETQVGDLPDQVRIGGAMTQQDWNLVHQFGALTISALAEFGYQTNQDVLDAHFQDMLSE